MFLDFSTERKSLNSFVDVHYWSYPFPSVHKSYIVICLGNRKCYSHHECLIYLYHIIFVDKSFISAFLAQDFYILFLLSPLLPSTFCTFYISELMLKEQKFVLLDFEACGCSLASSAHSLFILTSLPLSLPPSFFSPSFLSFFDGRLDLSGQLMVWQPHHCL